VVAVREARDRLTQGRTRDRDALYALVDRVVHGRSDAEIAAREGVSDDVVARRLDRAREEIFAALIERETGLARGAPEEVRLLLARIRRASSALGRACHEPGPSAVDLKRGVDLVLGDQSEASVVRGR
jgi:hypothetical protein